MKTNINDFLQNELVQTFPELIDWETVSMSEELSEDLLIQNIDQIYFDHLVKHRVLSNEIIETYIEKIMKDPTYTLNEKEPQQWNENYSPIGIWSTFEIAKMWSLISSCGKLTTAFLEEYQDQIDFNEISRNPSLPEEAIFIFRKKLDFNDISEFHPLSAKIINQLHSQLDLETILGREDISKETRAAAGKIYKIKNIFNPRKPFSVQIEGGSLDTNPFNTQDEDDDYLPF
jgi:hypothetical protein